MNFVKLASAPSVDEDDDFGAFGSAATAPEPTTCETESWTPQFTESPRENDREVVNSVIWLKFMFQNWEENLLQEIIDVEWKCENTEDVVFDENSVSEISPVLNAADKSIGEECPLKQLAAYVMRCIYFSRAFELWCLLRIVEEAKSLQYVFDGSTLASNHYKKINIDKVCLFT